MVKKHAKIISLNYFKVLVGVVLFGIAFWALMLPAAMSAYASSMSNSIENKSASVLQDSDIDKSPKVNENKSSDQSLTENEKINSIIENKGENTFGAGNNTATNEDYQFTITLGDGAGEYIQIVQPESADISDKNEFTFDTDNPCLSLHIDDEQEFDGSDLLYTQFVLTSENNKWYDESTTDHVEICYIQRKNNVPACIYCKIYYWWEESSWQEWGNLDPMAQNPKDRECYDCIYEGKYKIEFCVDTDVIPIYLNGYNEFLSQQTDNYGLDYYWANDNVRLQPYKYERDMAGYKGNSKYCFLISKESLPDDIVVAVDEMCYPAQSWQESWGKDGLVPWKRIMWREDNGWVYNAPPGLNMVISFKTENGFLLGQLMRNSKLTSSDIYDYHWQAKIYTLSAPGTGGMCSGLLESNVPAPLENIKALQIDSTVSLTNNIWVDASKDLGTVDIVHSILKNGDWDASSCLDQSVSANFADLRKSDAKWQSDQSFFLSSSSAKRISSNASLKWKVKWESNDTIIISNAADDQSKEVYKLTPRKKIEKSLFKGWKLYQQNPGKDASRATIDDPRGQEINYTKPIEGFEKGSVITIPGNTKIAAMFELITDATLQGIVYDSQKQPLKGALVKFKYDNSPDVYTSLPTGDDGAYSLTVPVPAGDEDGQLWVELPDGTVLSDPITIANSKLKEGGEVPVDPIIVKDEGSAFLFSFSDFHARFSMFAYDVVDGFPTLTDFQSWMWLNAEFNDEGYFVVDDFGRLNYYYRTGAKTNGAFDYKHVVIYAVPIDGYEVDSWYINTIKLHANIPYKASFFKFSDDASLYISVDYKEQVGPVPPVPPTPPDPPVPPGPVPPQPVPPVPPQPVPPFNPGGDIPATGDSTLGIIMLSLLACAGACCVFAKKRINYSK